MADGYDCYEQESTGGGFMMGLLTGTVLGAGLGMLLAPKSGSELRGQISEGASNVGSRVTDMAGSVAERGRQFVDCARDAVSRGAEEAQRYAGEAQETIRDYTSGTTGGGTTGSTGSTGTGSAYGTGGPNRS